MPSQPQMPMSDDEMRRRMQSAEMPRKGVHVPMEMPANMPEVMRRMMGTSGKGSAR